MQMVEWVHLVLSQKIKNGDRAVDATAGNGWDTLKLCELTGPSGRVYSFDIQKSAVSNTKKLLKERGMEDRAEIFCCSHSEVDKKIKGEVKAFTMNLGYLPGGDKSIVTRKDSTLQALKKLTNMLESGGTGTVLVYYGQEGGFEEKQGVEAFMESIPAGWGQVIRLETVNRKNNPPILYIMEKK